MDVSWLSITIVIGILVLAAVVCLTRWLITKALGVPQPGDKTPQYIRNLATVAFIIVGLAMLLLWIVVEAKTTPSLGPRAALTRVPAYF